MSKRNAPRTKKRRVSRRQLIEAASRLRRDVNGELYVVRFSLSQRVEHMLLLISFIMLAVTGLAQRYAESALGTLLLRLLGGIETSRQIHHIFALLFFLQSVYHLLVFVYDLFVKRQRSEIMPSPEDLKHLGEMIRYNLGRSDKHPHFGRYTFEEKMEYWALVWGALVMGLTGAMQWFPTIVTRWLPGSVIPIARAIHGWEAVLAAATIAVWHSYHVLIKTRNTSMFTGKMSIAQMEEEHPAELEFILWAASKLEELQSGSDAQQARNEAVEEAFSQT